MLEFGKWVCMEVEMFVEFVIKKFNGWCDVWVVIYGD